MSFILDALRKSESERQREAPASLTHMPMAAPRSAPPAWIWLVIVSLAAIVVVLAGAWWRSAQTVAPQAAPAAAADRARGSLRGAADPAGPAGDSQPLIGEAPVRRPEPMIAAGAAAAAAPGAESPSRSLPSAADVMAAGVALPPLVLQLVSYSDDPAERFVFINGFQYRQGQRVQNGPLVVSIYAEGVVLRHAGRDFILLPQ